MISEINEPDEPGCKGPAWKKTKHSESSYGQSQSKPQDLKSEPSATGTSLSLYDIFVPARVDGSVESLNRGIIDNEGHGKQYGNSISGGFLVSVNSYPHGLM
ncbi:hypothetical protein SERLA73DRAFT_147376, partial [Serpula lacrymans var. lacrymans S7.3]